MTVWWLLVAVPAAGSQMTDQCMAKGDRQVQKLPALDATLLAMCSLQHQHLAGKAARDVDNVAAQPNLLDVRKQDDFHRLRGDVGQEARARPQRE